MQEFEESAIDAVSRRLLLLHRFTREEKGLQLVEAAIALPILLLLFAATAEFGLFFYEYTTLAKAARAGSRYLSTAPFTPAAIERLLRTSSSMEIRPAPVRRSCRVSQRRTLTLFRPAVLSTIPNTVTIEIDGFTHDPIFDLGLLTKSEALSLNVDVSPSVTMRHLNTQPPPLD